MSNMLDAALAAADRGWPVFMLGRSKRPVANCTDCPSAEADPRHDRESCPCLTCHGFYAATRDPDRVAEIVAAVSRGQLAVRTGASSGLVVVDVDPAHDGIRSMSALIQAGMLPPTARVLTGSGGMHLYYAHPGRPIPCSQSVLGPGLDVRADGGYAVLPPSIHQRTGRAYRWADDGRPVEEMPPALAAACVPTSAARAFRVLLTGSRTWTDTAAVTVVLDRLLRDHGPALTIVHGACPRGADAIADAWCRHHHVTVERHPADWSTGRRAGPARNAAMVATRPVLCLAFIRDASPGATGCANLADHAGIRTLRNPHPDDLPTTAPASTPVALAGAGGISYPDRLLNTLLDRVRTAAEGRRRTTLYGVARGVAKMVAAGCLTSTDAETALVGVGREAGQTDREIRAAIDGGFRAEGVTR
ncbi:MULTISPECIES: bifunctional DNA primase/polymerase [Catenuloplanes]|uniref:DNA primase/polymerase bifunctional N-terminal domain-containing protein n=1 Tax=Catenuloplanes niger TaxID=587534 RepID=A0AAE3ZQA1_9ACTN|nr:bifunctional DNA primase/polymerase [Catenuloplanes niger]MDR7322941.1 hypothetical protein [Catenuloplanes niger]